MLKKEPVKKGNNNIKDYLLLGVAYFYAQNIHVSLIATTLTREYNQREKDSSAKLCVSMLDNQTTITSPKTNEIKKFAFDYSYWYVLNIQTL